MNEVKSIAIVGASAAGGSAVRTLRQLGYANEIILFDADERGSYERPPLSKEILMNPDQSADTIRLLADDELESSDVTTHFGVAVTAIDPQSGCLETATGQHYSADAIILATGGKARSLPLPGADADGVFYLRDFEDAQTLRSNLPDNARVAVIGGGFIGAEVVASLSSLGHNITWIDAADKPLAHVLPEAICTPLLAWHQNKGVEIICNAKISNFAVENGRVCAVNFSDRHEVNVDAVVVGVGMAPRSQLAEQAGLELALGGVKVDGAQRTSAENIYACGDVAAVELSTGEIFRDEHWQAAEHQGANAARAILGEAVVARPVPWFWSDQGGLHIEMAGKLGTESVVRVEGDWPVVFEMDQGALVGVCSVNQPNAVRVGLRLLRQSIAVSPHELADANIDLRSLLKRKLKATG